MKCNCNPIDSCTLHANASALQSELAKLCRAIADGNWSIVNSELTASIKLLEKTGFSFKIK
jgi:hypothetical protein